MYEVYALKYGERDTTACQFFFREPSHEPVTLDFYVWLILGGPHPIMVDAGITEHEARERAVRNYVSPAALVQRVGVKPADVATVLVTHLHWDHWAGHSLFPNARFWVQRREVAFWTGEAARHEVYRQLAHPTGLAQLITLSYANRVRLVDAALDALPGIHLEWVGGHTAGLQIVTVETAQGPVVLTSDASHFYRNLERRQPVQLITDLPQMLAGFETIERLAGPGRLIVAGHDPDVAVRFKPVEPGVIRIA